MRSLPSIAAGMLLLLAAGTQARTLVHLQGPPGDLAAAPGQQLADLPSGRSLLAKPPVKPPASPPPSVVTKISSNAEKARFEGFVDNIPAGAILAITDKQKSLFTEKNPPKRRVGYRLDKQLNGKTSGAGQEGLFQLAVQDNVPKSQVFGSVLLDPKLQKEDSMGLLRQALKQSQNDGRVKTLRLVGGQAVIADAK